jgi:peptide/nickel transport system substrate-binding protein
MRYRSAHLNRRRLANNSVVAAALVVFLASWQPVVAYSQAPIRVAVALFPVAQGNPFRDVIAPRTLPHTAVFDTLTRMTAAGELVPQLAVSWQAQDPLTWVFKLRAGVEFSNGQPLTATTIVEVIELLRAPEAAAYSVIRELRSVKKAQAVDAQTLVITTHFPDLMLARSLSGLRIPEPAHWRRLGAVGFAQHPIGSGSFKVDEWSPSRIRLAPWAGAWRPAASSVEVLLIPDEAARLQAFLSGAVDIAVGVGPEDEVSVASVGGRSHIQVGARVMTLAFVTVAESPLQDSRVRRALNFAVNRPLIVETILGSATVPASQAIPRQAFGYDPELSPYPFDPEKARTLLAEAGFADGFEITATVAVGGGAGDEAFFQAIAQDLRRVGVRLRLQRISLAKLVQYIYEGGWPGEVFGMDYGTEPTLDGLRPFFLHSCLWSKPWHCDPVQVPVIQAAQREFDPRRREAMVRQLVRRHYEDPPGIMLFELPRFDALGPGVQGYTSGPGWIDLATLRRQ